MAAEYFINESDPFDRTGRGTAPSKLSLVYKPVPLRIESIDLEVATLETHTSTAEPTANPIESGANVSDHVKQNPDELSIEAVISDASLDDDKETRDADYSKTTYEKLRTLKENGEPLTLVTSLRDYENMVLTKLTVPRDVARMNAVYLSMTFKQIKTVSLAIAPAPVPTKKSAKKTTDKGKKPAQNATKKPQSGLFKSFGGG